MVLELLNINLYFLLHVDFKPFRIRLVVRRISFFMALNENELEFEHPANK